MCILRCCDEMRCYIRLWFVNEGNASQGSESISSAISTKLCKCWLVNIVLGLILSQKVKTVQGDTILNFALLIDGFHRETDFLSI